MNCREAQLDTIRQVILDARRYSLPGMHIGQRIRRRRDEKGLALQKLADQIGVSKNAVHLWENKERPEITVENLVKLAEALEMPISDLLPPEATGKDVTVRDPQRLLLLERFDLLSPPQREAYLRLLVVMREDQDPES